MLCRVLSNPTPQAVPVYDWSPPERRTIEYTTLECTSLTLEQLMEELRADLLAPMMDTQQTFLQPGPMHSKTQSPVNQPEIVTKHLEVRLCPIGLFDGKMIYGAPGDRVPPPVNACSPEKRKRVSEQDDDTLYIKKPPNAFMVYRTEQRLKVLAGLRNSDCAAVNTIIGQMWRALSKKEQEKYYEESARLKQIHSQLYPDWSARDNYRKRSPRRARAKTDFDFCPGRDRRPRFAPSWRNLRDTSYRD